MNEVYSNNATAPAESEISSETIDLSEPDNSGSVSVEGDTLTVHPVEETTVEVKDNCPDLDEPTGYVTTTVPPFPGFNEWVDDQINPSRMKYSEDEFLADALAHIKSTYGQHYANPDKQGIQVFDLWDSLNSLDTTARDTAIKYLARYGRKSGYNKIDLFKAIHYICMLYYATQGK